MNQEHQGFPWILLLIGLVIGLVGGVYYAWYLNPVSLANVSPQQLDADDQKAYILLVSDAYRQDANLDRARARLNATGARDLAEMVVSQANSAYLGGATLDDVQALTLLAEALGGNPLAEMFPTAEPTSAAVLPSATFEGISSPTPTLVVPTATPTLVRPTVTPTHVLIPSDSTLKLVSLETICQSDHPSGQIEVYVNDVDGNGIPAIKIMVEWGEQKAAFFTGLKLDIDPGYADFKMEPNQTYTITLDGLAEPVFGIDSHACETRSGTAQVPTYELVFEPTMDQP